jgi:hypothetical protein
MTDPVLLVAWLVFAHVVADFVLQNDWIALNKGRGGRSGWLALAAHSGHVVLCLLPVAPAFGWPGVAYVVVAAGSHAVIDAWKVQATRRAERAALEAARRWDGGTEPPPSGLGSAWTAWPGMLFLADQGLHHTVAIIGWLVLLDGVQLQPGFVAVVDTALRSWDRATVHSVILTGVVLLAVFLVNTRGAYYFVLSLVSPREPVTDAQADRATRVPGGASARIAATTAALERLLVVTFLLLGADLAIPLLIVARILAHHRQLEDRGYLERFVLETLAGLTIAISTGVVARAALGTLHP